MILKLTIVLKITSVEIKYNNLAAIKLINTLSGGAPKHNEMYPTGKADKKTKPPIRQYFFNFPIACTAHHIGFVRTSISVNINVHCVKLIV